MSDNLPDGRAHLEATLISFEAGVAALSPAAARGVIERWLNILADHPHLNDIATTLGELREALTAKPIDGRRVGPLMTRLGSRTEAAARTADEDLQRPLERMATLLTHAGRRIGASPAPDSRQPGTGPQQPSTHHGQNPGNTGSRHNVGNVPADGDSRTPGR